MTAKTTAERRSVKLDFRVSPSTKAKLQAAATLLQCSVSDFILTSALSRAEEALAERTVFRLDAATWEAFEKALDAPTRPLPRLKALLSEPGFFNADGQ